MSCFQGSGREGAEVHARHGAEGGEVFPQATAGRGTRKNNPFRFAAGLRCETPCATETVPRHPLRPMVDVLEDKEQYHDELEGHDVEMTWFMGEKGQGYWEDMEHEEDDEYEEVTDEEVWNVYDDEEEEEYLEEVEQDDKEANDDTERSKSRRRKKKKRSSRKMRK